MVYFKRDVACYRVNFAPSTFGALVVALLKEILFDCSRTPQNGGDVNLSIQPLFYLLVLGVILMAFL